MRKVNLIETLIYYDGPELFVGRDSFGTNYLCWVVGRDPLSDRYLCIPISQETLAALKGAEVDLRTVLESAEVVDRHMGVACGDVEGMELTRLGPEEFSSDWLPAPGLLLPQEYAPAEELLTECRVRNRAIIRYALRPPEARTDKKITAYHLGEAVILLQRLVKHAFRRYLRDFDDSVRRDLYQAENYTLNAYATGEGSFAIYFETARPADMLGYSHVSRALQLIDTVSESMDDPNKTVRAVAGYGGHFAAAYRDLVRFLSETDTSLTYEWCMPELEEPSGRTITAKLAKPVYEALASREDLGQEIRRLVGRVTEAGERGMWRLLSDQDGKEYRGRLHREAPKGLLSGIVISQRYEFVCEESLEEERGTGRESTVLYLKSCEALP